MTGKKTIRQAIIEDGNPELTEKWDSLIEMLEINQSNIQEDNEAYQKLRQTLEALERRGWIRFFPKWLVSKWRTGLDDLSSKIDAKNKLQSEMLRALGIQPSWTWKD